MKLLSGGDYFLRTNRICLGCGTSNQSWLHNMNLCKSLGELEINDAWGALGDLIGMENVRAKESNGIVYVSEHTLRKNSKEAYSSIRKIMNKFSTDKKHNKIDDFSGWKVSLLEDTQINKYYV